MQAPVFTFVKKRNVVLDRNYGNSEDDILNSNDSRRVFRFLNIATHLMLGII